MTFSGKILVVLNMVMSIFFMGFAMIVYTTRVDLRGELAQRDTTLRQVNLDLTKANTENTALSKEVADLKTERDQSKLAFDQEVQNLKAANDDLSQRVKDYESRNKRNEAVADTAADNQNIRNEEIDQLRKYREELISKNSDLQGQNAQLKDRLLETGNELKSTLSRNEQLAQTINEFERYLAVVTEKYDVPSMEELSLVGTDEFSGAPPNVEGIVTRVDGKYYEISLGEDDGIRKGHELVVYRTEPEGRYLGKIKIDTTTATSAVAKPLSTLGLIQPNDRVASEIVPYRSN